MSEPREVHPAITDMLENFEYKHLPENLQEVSIPVCQLAHDMARQLEGAELTAGLRKLLEAKDCFVRAALKSHKRAVRESITPRDS